jgi:tetratricopeptide (TPR) repeat protein
MAFAGFGAWHSWRLGPATAPLVAGSCASAACWLVQSSYDWFWNYPGLTAPVLFMLGAAAGPAVLARSAGRVGRARSWSVVLPAIALLAAVPLFFSQRYANRAYGEWRANPGSAFDDLDRAAQLDPFDPAPLLAKGVIASRLGQSRQAASAFRDAIDRQGESYAAHYLLARTLASTNPAAARAEADQAVRLNPLDPRLRRLDRRLQSVQQP